jgi:glycerol uptake facilitator-like aquaporin
MPLLLNRTNKVLMQNMNVKILSEFVGTALLLAVITGSGLMGVNLAQGNDAIALLGNSIATGCGLYVLITLLGPISGAHFNPQVTIMLWYAKAIQTQQAIYYVIAQCMGGIVGVWLTHIMFDLPWLQQSLKPRHGIGQWVSEVVSTVVLLTVIKLAIKHASEKIAMLVALTVTAGYWFTSSTFFANSAVTLARALTNTFVGIAPADMLVFISAQLAALLLVLFVSKLSASA